MFQRNFGDLHPIGSATVITLMMFLGNSVTVLPLTMFEGNVGDLCAIASVTAIPLTMFEGNVGD